MTASKYVAWHSRIITLTKTLRRSWQLIHLLDVPVIIIRQISLQEAPGVREHQKEALVKLEACLCSGVTPAGSRRSCASSLAAGYGSRKHTFGQEKHHTTFSPWHQRLRWRTTPATQGAFIWMRFFLSECEAVTTVCVIAIRNPSGLKALRGPVFVLVVFISICLNLRTMSTNAKTEKRTFCQLWLPHHQGTYQGERSWAAVADYASRYCRAATTPKVSWMDESFLSCQQTKEICHKLLRFQITPSYLFKCKRQL